MLLMSYNYRAAIIAISQLSVAAQAYIWKYLGISNTIRKAYIAGICKYTAFCFKINQPLIPVCFKINQPLIPVCEDTLRLFVTCLAQQNLSYATIQVYLSAVRYSSITSAKTTTLRTPRLNYIRIRGYMQEKCCKPSA